MPDSICLKLWMAVCWKVSWKLDPLPLSVPLRPLPDEPPLVVLELQAESDKAIAARAAPAITTPWLRTRCMSNIPSQLPAEYCEEDGLDRARAVSTWPKIMLAPVRTPRRPPRGRQSGSRTPAFSRSAVTRGSWHADRRCSVLTWGLSLRCHDRAAPAVLAARGLPLL